jgi:hypothetical protein
MIFLYSSPRWGGKLNTSIEEKEIAMPRGRIGSGLSIGALEMMLQQKRGEIAKLKKQRTLIERELIQIDRRIELLGGGKSRAGGRKNAKSLVATLEDVLKKSGKPMQVADIVAGVGKAGYHSNSANFRGLVNQTLIKEKRFASAGRGLYQMK